MHWLYQLVSYLFIGLLLPVWALHPKLRQGILRRLGLYRDRRACVAAPEFAAPLPCLEAPTERPD